MALQVREQVGCYRNLPAETALAADLSTNFSFAFFNGASSQEMVEVGGFRLQILKTFQNSLNIYQNDGFGMENYMLGLLDWFCGLKITRQFQRVQSPKIRQ